MSAYGDYIIVTSPKDIAPGMELLTEQVRETLKELYPDDKWPDGIVQASIGWKLKESTQVELNEIARIHDKEKT